MICSDCKFWGKSLSRNDVGTCKQIFAKYEMIPLPDRIDENGKAWKTSKLLKVRDGVFISGAASNSKIYTSGDWGCTNFEPLNGETNDN